MLNQVDRNGDEMVGVHDAPRSNQWHSFRWCCVTLNLSFFSSPPAKEIGNEEIEHEKYRKIHASTP